MGRVANTIKKLHPSCQYFKDDKFSKVEKTKALEQLSVTHISTYV